MIKNIVFDMGKVLCDYDANLVCKHYIKDDKDIKLVKDAIFVSPEWILLDMGCISEERALQAMLNRIPKRLWEEARLCMRDWHLYNLSTIEEMGELIKKLKDRRYKLYICSNAAARLESCYKNCIPNWNLFDGILFSAIEKVIKPQRQIYEILFKKFNIKAEESFFIDDLDINIEAAKKLGMDGYIFDGNIEKLVEILNIKLNGVLS